MRKKIMFLLLCPALALGLSGCRFPFIDKEVTVPLFEKKGEEVLGLMMDRMAAAKIFTYTADFDVKIDLSEKLSFGSGNRAGMVLSSLGGPAVLGIDNLEAAREGAEGILPAEEVWDGRAIDLRQGTTGGTGADISGQGGASVMPSPFFAGFDFGPQKIEMDYDITGRVDDSDADNEKMAAEFGLAFDLGGLEIKLKAETVAVGNKVYFKIGQLPYPLSLFAGDKFSDRWFEIDAENFAAEYKEELGVSMGGIDMENFDIAKNKEKNERLGKEIFAAVKDGGLLRIDERLRDEAVGGRKSYRYRIGLNKDKLAGVVEKIFNAYEKEFNEINPKILYGFDKDDKFREAISRLADIFAKAEMEAWIDKKDFYLRKALFDFEIDPAKLEDGETRTFPGPKAAISVKGGINYENFNQPLEIKAPEGASPFLDFFEKTYLAPTKARSRDARRMADINMMQTALELYYNDAHQYPETLLFGEKLAYNMQTYMPEVPANPKPNDGECAADFDYAYAAKDGGQAYELSYCLGGATGGIPAGYHIATPGSMTGEMAPEPGVYKPSAETDTDGDGLLDYEEEIYQTDADSADTDGDGYTDGEEVKNGYNPAGEGKLAD